MKDPVYPHQTIQTEQQNGGWEIIILISWKGVELLNCPQTAQYSSFASSDSDLFEENLYLTVSSLQLVKIHTRRWTNEKLDGRDLVLKFIY